MKILYLITITSIGLIVVLFGSEIKIVHASQTTEDPYHVGNITDNTYNETAALQRVTQIMNMHDVLLQEKQDLESQLSNTTNSTDVKTINMKIGNVTGQINQVMQEFNEIQAENLKLYYIDPTLLKKYQTAADNFTSKIQTQYWNEKSTFEEKKDVFPLVFVGVNDKTKSVEITLWKDIENTTKADQYTTIINQLMPTDVPWFVDYGEYPISYTSVQVQNSSNATSQILSPHKQFQSGVAAQDVKCVQGFQLIVKSEDGSPACTKDTSIGRLVRQGWWVWNDKVGDTVVNTPDKRDFDNKTCGITDTMSSIVGTNGFVKDDLPKDGIIYPGINFTAPIGHAIQFSMKPNSDGYITFTYDFNQYPGDSCKVTTKDVIAATTPGNPGASISELIGSPDILKVDQNSVDVGSSPLGNSGDITLSLASAEDLNDHVVKVTYKISTKPNAQVGKSYYIGFWWHSSVVITVGDSLYTGTAFAGLRYG